VEGYNRDSNAFAIRTTVGRLCCAFGANQDYRPFAGMIDYIGYSSASIEGHIAANMSDKDF
jgi:hypothetical protein